MAHGFTPVFMLLVATIPTNLLLYFILIEPSPKNINKGGVQVQNSLFVHNIT
jgi:hypothetical protein